jgi:phosphoribosyl-ATP pyrophosphohydrolase/phosphoribosyl-AMP cyclohydrolase/histidinol dehydrogenase
MNRVRELPPRRAADLDPQTLAEARAILEDVRLGGHAAARAHAERLGDLTPGGRDVLGPDDLRLAWEALPDDARGVLSRTADRIRAFASAHRSALVDGEIPVPGGRAGWRYAPVERAGCYAPGGRYPLPSSVLMTAVTARVAGVAEVWVASPRPALATLAAAHLAGADRVLAIGGAQAIGALAWGTELVPRCDAIVGPGNRWVTAAKQLVAGRVAIDMLAGPSELVVIADDAADPALVAADLLAQAEHDDDAVPILLCTSGSFADAVDAALEAQLVDLPTAPTARRALQNGFTMVAEDLPAAVALADALAPEHLELHCADAGSLRPRHYGGLFVGAGAAEVLGDYGAGPNHVLPTGGTARSVGALSVGTFLRAQTWLTMDEPAAARELARDAAALGRIEGLEAHARAADRRS